MSMFRQLIFFLIFILFINNGLAKVWPSDYTQKSTKFSKKIPVKPSKLDKKAVARSKIQEYPKKNKKKLDLQKAAPARKISTKQIEVPKKFSKEQHLSKQFTLGAGVFSAWSVYEGLRVEKYNLQYPQMPIVSHEALAKNTQDLEAEIFTLDELNAFLYRSDRQGKQIPKEVAGKN